MTYISYCETKPAFLLLCVHIVLGHVEPRDGDLVSHKEPNGSVVIKVSAPHLLLLHTYKVLSGFSLRSESLKSDLVPLLSAFLCLHRRSNGEENRRKGSLGLGHSW